jgi:uncharacterized damage-inducible protein DinB
MTLIDSLRQQAGMTRAMVRMNTDQISDEESLIQPQPAGNCLNWVLGHLLTTYNSSLPLLGQPRVAEPEELAHYARGSEPITGASEALPLHRLGELWNLAADRFDAGLATLSADRLREPSAFSPTGNPNETIGSLLVTVLFHQSYHSGQLGLLRRLTGKPGAVK